jgi:integrase
MAPRKKPTTPVRTRRAQGEGSIKQRPNGLWVGTFTYGTDPVTGKPKRHQVTGMDKAKFEAKFADAIAAAKNDRPIEGSSAMTIETWMRLWWGSVSKVRPDTKRARKANVEHIIKRLGSVPIGELSRKHVEDLHDYLMAPKPRGAGLAPSSAATAHSIFQTAIEEAIGYYNGKVINYNAVKHTDAPEVDEAEIQILEPDEAIRVLDHVWDQRNGSRWAMAILTGARQGEVLGLTWDRVDFANDKIKIDRALKRLVYSHGCLDSDDKPTCGEVRTFDCPQRFIDVGRKRTYRPIELEPGLFLVPTKTKSSVRTIPLVEPLRTFLVNHRARQLASGEPNPHNLVWTRETRQVGGGTNPAAKTAIFRGQPIDPARDNAAWGRMLADVKVPIIKLHDARHTAITLLYELGVDELTIQDIAGHADERITREYRKDGRLTKQSYDALTKLGADLTPEGRVLGNVTDAEVIEGEFLSAERPAIAA